LLCIYYARSLHVQLYKASEIYCEWIESMQITNTVEPQRISLDLIRR